jgi:hypothetical protein
MIGAVMWMAYAIVMHSAPVFVANLLVLVAAAATMVRPLRGGMMTPAGAVPDAREAS